MYPDETCSFFGDKACSLYWDQGKHCKTIPFNDNIKTATFFTAPSYINCHAFNAVFEADDTFVPYQHILQFHILQFDKSVYLSPDQATFDSTKFVAKEDLISRRKEQTLQDEMIVLQG